MIKAETKLAVLREEEREKTVLTQEEKEQR